MVKFNLDKKAGKESPIFLSLHYRGKRIKIYTGKKILANQWDFGACRANPRKYKNNCTGFNEHLQAISNEVEKLINNNEPISKSDIVAIIDKANGKETTQSFFGFCEAYIQHQIGKGELKAVSAKAYTGTLNHLSAVNPRLEFNDIDLNFYDKFVGYLRDQDIATNSIGGHIKRLKWFMAASFERGLHSNVDFKKKAFKSPKDDTDEIYLTRDEIKKLEKKPMSEKLRRVADAFVLNTYLGQRYNDWAKIQKENFKMHDGLYHWKFMQEKTGEMMNVPVPHEALRLLKKYKFNCPVLNPNGKLMSNQKFNDYIKDATIEAGINEEVDIRENGNSVKYKKHELISSHTARRSLATNLYLEELPIQNIMAITGHKKEDTFLLYVRADQLTKSKGIAAHYKRNSKVTMKYQKEERQPK